jgi:hypothetical protein
MNGLRAQPSHQPVLRSLALLCGALFGRTICFMSAEMERECLRACQGRLGKADPLCDHAMADTQVSNGRSVRASKLL